MRAIPRRTPSTFTSLTALCVAALLAGCGNDGGGSGADAGQGSDVGGQIDAAQDTSAGDDSAGGDTATGEDSAEADTALGDAAASDVPVSDVPVSDVPVSDVPVSDVPVPDDTGALDTAGNDTAANDTAVSDTAANDTAVSDTASSDAGDAAGGVQCNGPKGSFPSFAKACSADSDCFVAQHQINCCGTKVAFGLSVSDKAAFEAAEAVCQSQYPGCGCAQFETMAEDGYSSFNDADFVATCQAGICRTSVPSAKPVCESTGLQKPKAVKACTATSDCTYLLQTIDCCGSQRAVGVAKFAKDALEKAEFACSQQMSICDCLPKPVQLEDGLTAGDGLTAVQCEAGSCMTYAK